MVSETAAGNADLLRSPRSGVGSWWTALGASLILLAGLNAAFVSYWESNDDVGMAMLAHGFGMVAQDSPRLIFSNVVWGWIVRIIPSGMQTSGYAWATLGVLLLVGAVIFRAVHRAGHGVLLAGLALALVMLRPVLFPQFTINAGLLCIGAIASWRCYAAGVKAQEDRAWIDLAIGCVLALLSYLVRSQEFLLVAAVGALFVPWQTLVSSRLGRVGLIALAAAIASAAWVDRYSYRNDEWANFALTDSARAPFTDFGAGERLKNRPEILNRHGLSRNDVDLVSNWFFIDSKVVEPQRLHAMVSELGPMSDQPGGIGRAFEGLKKLWHPALIPLFAAAFLLCALNFSFRLVAVWFLTLASAIAMGWVGRPGVTRVYVPLVVLLVMAPLLVKPLVRGWRRVACMATLILSLFANATQVFDESRAAEEASARLRRSISGLPAQLIVVWGESFPYQLAYPVVGPSFVADFDFYALGVFTRAPVSTAFAIEAQGDGLVRRLQTAEGISIVADLRWLDIYCQEHLRSSLSLLQTLPFDGFTLQRVRCAPSGDDQRPNAQD